MCYICYIIFLKCYSVQFSLRLFWNKNKSWDSTMLFWDKNKGWDLANKKLIIWLFCQKKKRIKLLKSSTKLLNHKILESCTFLRVG